MAGEWKTVTLRDALGAKGYIRGPFGSALRRPELKSSGIPVYEQQHAITGTREFRFYIDEEKYSTLRRFAVQPNDLIVSCSGTLARVSMIREEDPVGIISQALLILRPDTSVVWPKYLYYFMSSKRGYDSLVGVSTGSVQVNIAGRSVIEQTELPLPPLPHQRAIACILGALDDKIELNRQMNETLEQIAQAIFKKWFIEPTKNGKLPEGWREDSIYLAADVIYGAPFSSAKFNTKKIGKPLIRIRNLANESPDVFTPEIHPKGYLVKPGDIVVGMDGEFRAYIWGGEKSWLNQRLCVFIPKPGFSAPYVLYSITRPLAEVEATETATTVIHLGKNDIDRFKIIIAPDKILASFNRIAEPLFKRIVLNKQKSRTLAALRDSLLPKLISGELRVPDAEKICARGASALGGMEKCS